MDHGLLQVSLQKICDAKSEDPTATCCQLHRPCLRRVVLRHWRSQSTNPLHGPERSNKPVIVVRSRCPAAWSQAGALQNRATAPRRVHRGCTHVRQHHTRQGFNLARNFSQDLQDEKINSALRLDSLERGLVGHEREISSSDPRDLGN